ncbi:hypothetical protein LCGC14_0914420 [marine sediment metagenome]|uniref:Uncharacterized protein n=1 Tax=marine sediment metagenome TaxID=412755 RepID=A0A0F9NXD7_9ZZZZ
MRRRRMHAGSADPLLNYVFAVQGHSTFEQARAKGPIPTFVRTSADTRFSEAGVLEELANNIPSLTHDPVTGVSYGLQVPRSTVNEARNNRAAGATNGVIGSGGVLPTDWTMFAGTTGLSREVVGTGTEDGLPYCDLRFFGTATAGQTETRQTSTTAVAALQNEVWTTSRYVRLVGGDFTNVTSKKVEIQERDSGGAWLGSSGGSIAPTVAALKTQRGSHTRTLAEATTAFITEALTFAVDAGAVDFTVRVAGAQLEEVPLATPLVLTDAGGSSTRAQGSPTIALSSVPGFDETAFTMYFEGMTDSINNGSQTLVQIDAGSNANRHRIYVRASADDIVGHTTVSSSETALIFAGTLAAGTPFKALYAVEANNIALFLDGAQIGATDTSAALPTALTTVRFGVNQGADQPLASGYCSRFVIWNGRQPDVFGQRITA